MNTTELDEFQGLTAQMVREWLTKQKAVFCDGRWTHPNGKYRYTDREYGGLLWPPTLSQMAVHFDKANEQALLREINPRMRKGIPSAAAIAAHEVSGGNWLAQSAQKGGVLRVLNWSISDHRAKLNTLDTTQKIPRDMVPDSWCFWPCDEHGNKVRWPTDADGKML